MRSSLQLFKKEVVGPKKAAKVKILVHKASVLLTFGRVSARICFLLCFLEIDESFEGASVSSSFSPAGLWALPTTAEISSCSLLSEDEIVDSH